MPMNAERREQRTYNAGQISRTFNLVDSIIRGLVRRVGITPLEVRRGRNAGGSVFSEKQTQMIAGAFQLATIREDISYTQALVAIVALEDMGVNLTPLYRNNVPIAD